MLAARAHVAARERDAAAENYAQAILAYQRAVMECEGDGNRGLVADLYTLLAQAYEEIGNFAPAADTFKLAALAYEAVAFEGAASVVIRAQALTRAAETRMQAANALGMVARDGHVSAFRPVTLLAAGAPPFGIEREYDLAAEMYTLAADEYEKARMFKEAAESRMATGRAQEAAAHYMTAAGSFESAAAIYTIMRDEPGTSDAYFAAGSARGMASTVAARRHMKKVAIHPAK